MLAHIVPVCCPQALSIRHTVAGNLEGVFALGQVYVLASRCTDPRNFILHGLPPKDLLEDIADAINRAGRDAEQFFRKCVNVTKEFVKLFVLKVLFAAVVFAFAST